MKPSVKTSCGRNYEFDGELSELDRRRILLLARQAGGELGEVRRKGRRHRWLARSSGRYVTLCSHAGKTYVETAGFEPPSLLSVVGSFALLVVILVVLLVAGAAHHVLLFVLGSLGALWFGWELVWRSIAAEELERFHAAVHRAPWGSELPDSIWVGDRSVRRTLSRRLTDQELARIREHLGVGPEEADRVLAELPKRRFGGRVKVLVENVAGGATMEVIRPRRWTELLYVTIGGGASLVLVAGSALFSVVLFALGSVLPLVEWPRPTPRELRAELASLEALLDRAAL